MWSLVKDNRFFVVYFQGRIYSQYLIIVRLARLALPDSAKMIELLRSLILHLSRFGGSLSLLLVKEEGLINIYLISLGSVVFRSLNKRVEAILAILESFAFLSGIEFEIFTNSDIKKITRLLLEKKVVFESKHKIELFASEEAQLINFFQPNYIVNSMRKAIVKILGDKILEIPFWKIMENNDAILLLLDLDVLKSLIRSNVETNRRLGGIFGGISNDARRIVVQQAARKIKIRFALYAFASLEDMHVKLLSKLKHVKEVYNVSFRTFFMLLNQYIRDVPIGSKQSIDFLLAIIMKKKTNIELKSKLEQALLLLGGSMLFMISVRTSRLIAPHLDICEEATRGDIHIGWQLKDGYNGAPFYIDLLDIKRHLLILGRTGSGKTRLARIIVEGLLKKGKTNVWIFDFHKEYIDLFLSNDFDLFEPGSESNPLYLNMFESQYEEPESYATFLTALLLEAIRLKGEEITAQMERALSYATWKTVSSENPDPTTFLRNLYEWCQEAESDIPTATYTFYAVANRMKSFFSGASKNIFWTRKSNVDIAKLLNKNVVFDLSFLLKRNLKREIILLVNIILRYTIMALFTKENLVDDFNPPRLIILIEEGRYLVPWRKIESTIETTAIEDFATLARKYGLGLIVISQSPYTISQDIINNVGTLFLMNSEIPEKEYVIVDDETLRRYIQLMPPRQAIVKLSRTPALIHIQVKEYIPPQMEFTIPSRQERKMVIEENFEEYIKKISRI